MKGIEPVDHATRPDFADRRQSFVVEPGQFGPEQGPGPRRGAAFETNRAAFSLPRTLIAAVSVPISGL